MIGCLSVLPYLHVSIINRFGILKELFSISHIISKVVAPLFFITEYLIYPICLSFVNFILGFGLSPLSPLVYGSGFYERAHSVSVLGIIIIYPMMIFFWYLISSLIVAIFTKIYKKFKK